MSKRDMAKLVLKNLGWLNVDEFIDTCDDDEVDEAVRAATYAAGQK